MSMIAYVPIISVIELRRYKFSGYSRNECTYYIELSKIYKKYNLETDIHLLELYNFQNCHMIIKPWIQSLLRQKSVLGLLA